MAHEDNAASTLVLIILALFIPPRKWRSSYFMLIFFMQWLCFSKKD